MKIPSKTEITVWNSKFIKYDTIMVSKVQRRSLEDAR